MTSAHTGDWEGVRRAPQATPQRVCPRAPEPHLLSPLPKGGLSGPVRGPSLSPAAPAAWPLGLRSLQETACHPKAPSLLCQIPADQPGKGMRACQHFVAAHGDPGWGESVSQRGLPRGAALSPHRGLWKSPSHRPGAEGSGCGPVCGRG